MFVHFGYCYHKQNKSKINSISVYTICSLSWKKKKNKNKSNQTTHKNNKNHHRFLVNRRHKTTSFEYVGQHGECLFRSSVMLWREAGFLVLNRSQRESLKHSEGKKLVVKKYIQYLGEEWFCCIWKTSRGLQTT